jgi:hypothetical protein
MIIKIGQEPRVEQLREFYDPECRGLPPTVGREIQIQIATPGHVVPDVSGEPIGPEEMGDDSVSDTDHAPARIVAHLRRKTRNTGVKDVDSDRRQDHSSDRYLLDLIEADLIASAIIELRCALRVVPSCASRQPDG